MTVVTAIIGALIAVGALVYNIAKDSFQQRQTATEQTEKPKIPSPVKPPEQPSANTSTVPASKFKFSVPFAIRVEKGNEIKFADDLKIKLTDVKLGSNPVGYRAYARVFYTGHPDMGINDARLGYIVEDYEYRIELVKIDADSATFSVSKRL